MPAHFLFVCDDVEFNFTRTAYRLTIKCYARFIYKGASQTNLVLGSRSNPPGELS